MTSVVELNRLRWRSRRGMLELDIVLTRFLDSFGKELADEKLAAFDKLLDCTDNEMWDLITGRSAALDSDQKQLLACLGARV